MSVLEQFATRLWWDGHRGAARDHGRTVPLFFPPVLPGLPDLVIERIDYIPYTLGTVMPRFERERDLFQRERLAVYALLEEMTR